MNGDFALSVVVKKMALQYGLCKGGKVGVKKTNGLAKCLMM